MEKIQKIFISYSRKDMDFVRRLARDLKKAGYDVSWDLSDLRGSDDWQSVIPAAIESSEYVIVVLSPNSVVSDWVQREYTHALSVRRRIVAIMIQQTELPLALSTIIPIDFTSGNYAEDLQRLLYALGYSGDLVPPESQPNAAQGVFPGSMSSHAYSQTAQTAPEAPGSTIPGEQVSEVPNMPAGASNASIDLEKQSREKPTEGGPEVLRKPATKQVVRPRKTPSVYSPPIAGYISDRADLEANDLLNIDNEVANIANVLTFQQVQPPIALGLFGDWGSGKTFFMGKLRRYIASLAAHYQQQESESSVEAMWCSRVAQIEFNAWHFSDSNLWASLVTRIYEGLDRELNKEKETAEDIKKKILEAQIQQAKEKSIKAESQLDLAKTRVTSAEDNLKQKSREREEKENTLLEMIGSLPQLLEGTEMKKPLQEAAVSLGMPEAAQTYEALEQLNGELKSASGRLTAVTASILHSPWTLVGMAFFVILLPVVFTFAIETWGGLLTEAGKRVAETSTFLLFIVGWLRTQVQRGLGLVNIVESALQTARAKREEKIAEDPTVVAARKELVEARTAEQAARANLELAQTELQRLQLELQELRPERKLQRLIETRASTGAYAQHLGIISLIRADFESMSRILAEMADEKRDFKKAPPIQRIILYIDDLDRCKPERVVEVLEAIHLLLYFPLFVVVVAVDPRWLRHSLTQHYPATLNEQGHAGSFDSVPGISLYSTPQDYLEKIFQIPFALRPIEKAGFQSLVDNLLKPLAPKKRAVEPTAQPAAGGTAPGGKSPTGSEQPARGAPAHTTDTRAAEPSSSAGVNGQAKPETPPAGTTFKPIPPRQLEFTAWEKEDIEQLWLMFRTPRTVKRFINIYRLLRAGLITDKQVKRFEGTRNNPGEYRVALLLLAAITAFPNAASQLLFRLDAWLDVHERDQTRKDTTWREIIDMLKSESVVSGRQTQRANGTKVRKPALMAEQGRRARNDVGDKDSSTGDPEAEDSWKMMLDCLAHIAGERAWEKPFEIAALRAWVMRVARFSFSVQPT